MSKCRVYLLQVFTLAIIICSCDDPVREKKEWIIHKEIGPLIVSPSAPGVVGEVFQIENPSKTQEMKLVLVHKSCLCTEYKVEPENVPPGGEAKITLAMRPSPNSRNSRMHAGFQTGLPEIPNLFLEIRMEAFPALSITTPSETGIVRIPAPGRQMIPFDVVAHQPLLSTAPPLFDIECVVGNKEISVVGHAEETAGGVRIITSHCQLIIPASTKNETITDGLVQIRARCGSEEVLRDLRWERDWPIKVIPSPVFLHANPAAETEQIVHLRAENAFSITDAITSGSFFVIV
jgi:hypothetical protein